MGYFFAFQAGSQLDFFYGCFYNKAQTINGQRFADTVHCQYSVRYFFVREGRSVNGNDLSDRIHVDFTDKNKKCDRI